VNKTDVLITDNLDLIDQAKAAKVVAELLLRRTLIQPAEINMARHGRRLAPSNLKHLAVEGELFDSGIGMKCRSSGTTEKRKENTRVFGEDAD
jgi:hypothetical protein